MPQRSFVEVAPDSHFPLQNLPFGIFSTMADPQPRAGVAIGEFVLDLAALEDAGVLVVAPAGERVFNRDALNAFIALGRSAWAHARSRIGELLRADHAELRDTEQPILGPTRKLDFELETAFIVGEGNALGEPIAVDDAERHIFGLVLLNDWSARDIQQWEYVPLGPFNSKTFATSISPWIVTLDALEAFRVAGPGQDPRPLPYLTQPGEHAFNIHLQVQLKPAGAPASTICRTTFRNLYWSMPQQLAHHTVSGCNTRIGDLMGSGTISGSTPDSFGSMLELAWNGQRPLALTGGATRSFLEDGDEVIITGWCQGEGYRVGFGEVRGEVVPALA